MTLHCSLLTLSRNLLRCLLRCLLVALCPLELPEVECCTSDQSAASTASSLSYRLARHSNRECVVVRALGLASCLRGGSSVVAAIGRLPLRLDGIRKMPSSSSLKCRSRLAGHDLALAAAVVATVVAAAAAAAKLGFQLVDMGAGACAFLTTKLDAASIVGGTAAGSGASRLCACTSGRAWDGAA